MKKPWVLNYPLGAQRRLCSDWADAQADLSVRWAHIHFVGFDMSRLNYYSNFRIITVIFSGVRMFSNFTVFEPSLEIMALFVLRKLILQTRMRSHLVGLEV